MNKISLKDWVIFLTIVPTTLIGISLAVFFSFHRFTELNENLNERASNIIEPIAVAAAAPMHEKERDKLRQLIGYTHRQNAMLIKNIVVFTPTHQEFVTSSYQADSKLLKLRPNEEIPKATTMTQVGNYLIYRAPILHELYYADAIDMLGEVNSLGYVAIQVDKDKMVLQQQNQIIKAFGVVFLGIIINAFFAFKLIRNVTFPITTMVHAIDRIREGKLESRVSGNLVGELSFLKNGINAMAQSLGDYHDEMQRNVDQATLDLRESLEQFEIQNVELDLAKRKAQDANRVKSEFLANMSHELRTPLNGVIGFTRQVLKTPLTETQRDYLQTIEKSGNNLLSIINDILDFSKLDAGRMVIESIPYSLRDSIDEVLTILAPETHRKHLELSVIVEPNLPDSLIGDSMRIKQVLTNLVGNAIKFTDQGSVAINVSHELLNDNTSLVKVEVMDTGVGIAMEQQQSLFEAFGQADQSVTRLYGGTGLGLVISKHLAEEMGGSIGFTSEVGKGSNFWFTFRCEHNNLPVSVPVHSDDFADLSMLYYEPSRHARLSTLALFEEWRMKVTIASTMSELSTLLKDEREYDLAVIAPSYEQTELEDIKPLIQVVQPYCQNIHLAVNNTSPNFHQALLIGGAKSCMSKPLTAKKLSQNLADDHDSSQQTLKVNSNQLEQKLPIKVLAVDDNVANLKLIKSLLLEQVNEVVTAENGLKAVALCEEQVFELIFMDIQMPVMDGVTALHRIVKSRANKFTPIIAVTAHTLDEERQKLLSEGFHSFLTKPLDETMLRHIIYEHCALEHLRADKTQPLSAPKGAFTGLDDNIFDWQLALKRAGNKQDLAKDMLQMLLASIEESQPKLTAALEKGDVDTVKHHIHRLNGACCYTGAANLGKAVDLLETLLKKDHQVDSLEPEFLELFDEIEKLVAIAPSYLDEKVSVYQT